MANHLQTISTHLPVSVCPLQLGAAGDDWPPAINAQELSFPLEFTNLNEETRISGIHVSKLLYSKTMVLYDLESF
jgi:hypothetical protein